jgi:hypothetical protein
LFDAPGVAGDALENLDLMASVRMRMSERFSPPSKVHARVSATA